MTRNVKIIVCCHKKDVMATQEPYMPIQVGKAIADIDLGIQGDNTGDNISDKNRSYCELTGLYWAWKNLKGVDIIGLCHYRRYFDFHKYAKRGYSAKAVPTAAFPNLDLSIPESVIDKVADGAVVTVKRYYLKYSIYFQYNASHFSKDLKTLQNVFAETQPKDMQRAFYKAIYTQNWFIGCNMLIMNRTEFDAYCCWLFTILAEVEKQTDISWYDDQQKRLYGYLGELLFNVWLCARKGKVVEVPMLLVNDNGGPDPSVKNLWRLRGWLATKIIEPRVHDLK